MADRDARLVAQVLKLADSGALDDAASDLLRRACDLMRRGYAARARLALAQAHALSLQQPLQQSA